MKTRYLCFGAVILACAIPVFGQPVEPKAGTWKTWIISSGKDFRVPPPPDAGTTAGELRAKYVIHTVGPIFGRHHGREPELLADCYRNSLRLAVEHSLSSIAFPAISTGAFGYPREEAAAVVSQAVSEFLEKEDAIRDLRLVFFHESDARVFLARQNFRLE